LTFVYWTIDKRKKGIGNDCDQVMFIYIMASSVYKVPNNWSEAGYVRLLSMS